MAEPERRRRDPGGGVVREDAGENGGVVDAGTPEEPFDAARDASACSPARYHGSCAPAFATPANVSHR